MTEIGRVGDKERVAYREQLGGRYCGRLERRIWRGREFRVARRVGVNLREGV